MDDFLKKFLTMPRGYVHGMHANKRYGVCIQVSDDGRRRKLYAEELGGTDRVSCNLYVLSNGDTCVKPCEMSIEKVRRFVLEFHQGSFARPHELGAEHRRHPVQIGPTD